MCIRDRTRVGERFEVFDRATFRDVQTATARVRNEHRVGFNTTGLDAAFGQQLEELTPSEAELEDWLGTVEIRRQVAITVAHDLGRAAEVRGEVIFPVK